MSDETYNGWTNRETWGVHIYVDELGLGEERDDMVRFQFTEDSTRSEIEETTRAWFEEQIDNLKESANDKEDFEIVFRVLEDIGSFWRVDWYQLGQAWLDDVEL